MKVESFRGESQVRWQRQQSPTNCKETLTVRRYSDPIMWIKSKILQTKSHDWFQSVPRFKVGLISKVSANIWISEVYNQLCSKLLQVWVLTCSPKCGTNRLFCLTCFPSRSTCLFTQRLFMASHWCEELGTWMSFGRIPWCLRTLPTFTHGSTKSLEFKLNIVRKCMKRTKFGDNHIQYASFYYTVVPSRHETVFFCVSFRYRIYSAKCLESIYLLTADQIHF